jgi:hypothetical protein
MHALLPADIAGWQLPWLKKDTSPEWVAALPSLQRGAVWKPGKVEMFWDSLFRGFPVGSLVLCEELEGQKNRFGRLAGSKDPWQHVPKRHLLDGQQRCNAIALGFFDPFDPGCTLPDDNILWIDLFPDAARFHGNTRQFLFRVTTRAHPWGFDTSDEARRISAGDMADAMGKDREERPAPRELFPVKSSVPVPLAWLIDGILAVRQEKKEKEEWAMSDDVVVFERLKARCRSTETKWAATTWSKLEAASAQELQSILTAARRALETAIPALELPREALSAPTRQEGHSVKDAGQEIANVEQLVVRLNNGGTPISAEELQYSMLKAYWPGIEHTIESIKPLPSAASRLAVLGARAAMSIGRKELPGAIGVGTLREIARSPDKKAERARLETYFQIGDADRSAQAAGLKASVAVIENWLLTRAHPDIGLPPALRSSIARRSPAVYLLLLILAQRVRTAGETEALQQSIVGLATTLHWFSVNQDKAVQSIYRRLGESDRITPKFFQGIFHAITAADQAGTVMLEIQSPSALDEIFVKPTGTESKDWNFWQGTVELPAGGDDTQWQRLHSHTWPFVKRILDNIELLLFAQRAWLAQEFAGYDKADAILWEDHNRPWDEDHLCPQSVFSNVRGARLLRMCHAWGWTLGNFHILSFGENRSRGDDPANQWFRDPEDNERMLLEPGELDAFSLTKDAVKKDAEAVKKFAEAVRRRILRIYHTWYNTLDIGNLLAPPASP